MYYDKVNIPAVNRQNVSRSLEPLMSPKEKKIQASV